MKARILFVLMLTLMVSSVGVLSARADNIAPAIASFQRTSPAQPTPGSQISFVITPSDEGGSGPAYAFVTYRSAHGQGLIHTGHSWQNGNILTGGRLTEWAESGAWTLESITISDRAGNETRYRRNGQIEVRPSGATPPTNSLDLSAGDFTIVNPDEDLKPPKLVKARMFMSNVIAGTPALVLYEATDEVSGVSGVSVVFRNPLGEAEHINDYSPLAGIGPAAGVIPLGAAGGRYTFESFTLIDRAANRTTYHADGHVTSSPSELPPPPGTPEGLSDLTFDVTPTLEDRRVPRLTSLALRTPMVRAGEQVVLDFTAEDEDSGMRYFIANYDDGDGHSISVAKRCGDIRSGPATRNVASYWPPGTWTLNSVSVYDQMMHHVIYYRNGQVSGPRNTDTPASHSFDFSAQDFTIEAGERRAEPPAATSDDFSCLNAQTVLSLNPNVPAADPGDIVPILGTVLVAGRAVRRPVTAFYAYRDGKPRLLGVGEGSDVGAIRRDVVATPDESYRARFFGAAGPTGGLPALSNSVAIRVTRAATASLSAPGTIGVGTTIAFGARLADAGTGAALAGRSVELQRRPTGTEIFRAVTAGVTGSNGWAQLKHAPLANSEYRVVFAGAGDHAGSVSPTRRVDVRPAVRLSASAPNATRAVALTISTWPAHPGAWVSIVRWDGKAWRTYANRKTEGSGVAKVFLTLPRGTTLLRAQLAAHQDHAAGASRELRYSL